MSRPRWPMSQAHPPTHRPVSTRRRRAHPTDPASTYSTPELASEKVFPQTHKPTNSPLPSSFFTATDPNMFPAKPEGGAHVRQLGPDGRAGLPEAPLCKAPRRRPIRRGTSGKGPGRAPPAICCETPKTHPESAFLIRRTREGERPGRENFHVGWASLVRPRQDWDIQFLIWARGGDACFIYFSHGGFPFLLSVPRDGPRLARRECLASLVPFVKLIRRRRRD